MIENLQIRLGTVAPYFYEMTVNADPNGFLDPLAVTSARIEVLKPDGNRSFWAATVYAQGALAVVIRAPLLLGYLDQLNKYQTWARVTVPTGEIVSLPKTIVVVP